MLVDGCHDLHGLFAGEANVFKTVLIFDPGKGCYLSVPLFHLDAEGFFLLPVAVDNILSRTVLEQVDDSLAQIMGGYQWAIVKIIANFRCQLIGIIEWQPCILQGANQDPAQERNTRVFLPVFNENLCH